MRDKKKPVGAPYYTNVKVQMDSVIMFSILNKVNQKLAWLKTKVILFLDNVSSHSSCMVGKYSNTNVVFLHKTNTTSHLQPLDGGIIKNLKAHYRKLTVKHKLSKTDGSTLTATQIAMFKMSLQRGELNKIDQEGDEQELQEEELQKLVQQFHP